MICNAISRIELQITAYAQLTLTHYWGAGQTGFIPYIFCPFGLQMVPTRIKPDKSLCYQFLYRGLDLISKNIVPLVDLFSH